MNKLTYSIGCALGLLLFLEGPAPAQDKKPCSGTGPSWTPGRRKYIPLLREKYQLKPERFPFDFDEVMAAIAPRAFFSCSPLRDANFDYRGVEKGIANVMLLYRALNVEDKLRVQYPDDVHDFPYETRQEAYRFIDSILKKPWCH